MYVRGETEATINSEREREEWKACHKVKNFLIWKTMNWIPMTEGITVL